MTSIARILIKGDAVKKSLLASITQTTKLIDNELFNCLRDDITEWNNIGNTYVKVKCGCYSSSYQLYDIDMAICKECCNRLTVRFYWLEEWIITVNIKTEYIQFGFYGTTSMENNIFVTLENGKLTIAGHRGKHDYGKYEGSIYDAKNLFLNFDKITRRGSSDVNWLKNKYYQSVPTYTLQNVLDKMNPNKKDEEKEYIIEI